MAEPPHLHSFSLVSMNSVSLAVIASEFTDPRLTLVENEAARAIVRRFADAFDGQVRWFSTYLGLENRWTRYVL